MRKCAQVKTQSLWHFSVSNTIHMCNKPKLNSNSLSAIERLSQKSVNKPQLINLKHKCYSTHVTSCILESKTKEALQDRTNDSEQALVLEAPPLIQGTYL